MNSVVLGLTGLGAMLALVAIRIPIAFCMALVGFIGMLVAVGYPQGAEEFDFQRGLDAAWAYTSFEPYSFIANFPIVAVPLFLLMGYVAFHAGFTNASISTDSPSVNMKTGVLLVRRASCQNPNHE